MRATKLGIFALGFACGLLFLTLALWLSGGLRVPAVAAGNKAPLPATTAPTPAPAPAPPPASPQPAPAASTTPPAEGSAAPAALHLAMPIAGVDPDKLTDTFTEIHDGQKHEALDIPAPRGTPVLAVAEGNVVKLFKSKPGGITVYQFDDSQTYCFYYAHLDRYAPGLAENTLLRKGDVLGYVGSTGNASPDAPHLHFAVSKLGPDKKWWEGTAIDPLPLLK
ncbi:MAG TPA: M23 family metallopeptidase [Bryobacteraceae bacterium]|jgi:murein DD-endopeptidase MepM/ murein hydrolase activator NlpD|nr:M23 family metallopeptidase [Bryobacteraceae bacterium]